MKDVWIIGLMLLLRGGKALAQQPKDGGGGGGGGWTNGDGVVFPPVVPLEPTPAPYTPDTTGVQPTGPVVLPRTRWQASLLPAGMKLASPPATLTKSKFVRPPSVPTVAPRVPVVPRVPRLTTAIAPKVAIAWQMPGAILR